LLVNYLIQKKMKKIVLLAAIAIFSVTAVNAQKKSTKAVKAAPTKVETPKVDGAGMVFENETIDYGTIPADSDGNRKFVFTNNGTKPLIISNTQGSCGCTVPTTPKEPIAPGAQGFIGVHYATDRAGQAFTKTVTVTSNAVGQETKVLTIKGNVLPRETPATPAAPTKS
jgi:outer membrane lipoprotein-sorting protein